MQFKLLTRVVVADDRGISIQQGTEGRVIRTDYKRSKHGYCIEVLWKEKVGSKRRRTWVPKENLAIY